MDHRRQIIRLLPLLLLYGDTCWPFDKRLFYCVSAPYYKTDQEREQVVKYGGLAEYSFKSIYMYCTLLGEIERGREKTHASMNATADVRRLSKPSVTLRLGFVSEVSELHRRLII